MDPGPREVVLAPKLFLRSWLDRSHAPSHNTSQPHGLLLLPRAERAMINYNKNQDQGLPGARKQAAGVRIVETVEGLRNGYRAALSESNDPREAVESLFFEIDDLAALCRATFCARGEA